MTSEAVTHISKGNAVFSNKLYNIFCKEEGNIFYSPLSMHAILSLVYQGAGGETAKSLKKVLGLPNAKTGAKGYQDLMEKLNSVEDVELHMANNIFTAYPLKPEFDAIARKHFAAEVENIKFTPDNAAAAGKINTWVEKNTNNKIKDLVKPEDLDEDTCVVLVNAIYFKGNWLHAFHPKDTEKEKFYLSETDTADCDMMHIRKTFLYAEDSSLDAQILRLPYRNESFGLMIILPRSKTGIKHLEKKLLTKTFKDLERKLSYDEVILSLPRFRIETTMNLKKPLQEMGLELMFCPLRAELRNTLAVNFPIYVSKAIQKAFIEVNEEGAEAAAATDMKDESVVKRTEIESKIQTVVNTRGQYLFSGFDTLNFG